MFLIISLILVTIAISGSAAFFSVYGLAQTFAVIFLPIVIMGMSLEIGKLVTASFLFQYWNKITLLFKSFLMFAVLGLMLITSWGIFGFLSAAHQTDTIDLKTDRARVEYLIHEKTEYESRLTNIDVQIKNVPDTHVTSKIKLIKALTVEKTAILGSMDKIDAEQTQLMSKKLTTEAKVGPIVFIARALGRDVDSATTILITLIMSVFDPLALALTIATNFAISDRKKKRKISALEASLPDNKPTTTTDKLDTLINYNNKRRDILKTVRDIDN